MKLFLFKNRTYISIILSLLIIYSLAYFMMPITTPIRMLILFGIYCINCSLNYLAIYYWCEKDFSYRESFRKEIMKLVGDIQIISKNGQKMARFHLENSSTKAMLEIETKKGIIGSHFHELNIDTIMIKPDKEYNVGILEEIRCFKGTKIDTVFVPVSIDYYDLQDKVYLFKITINYQKEG